MKPLKPVTMENYDQLNLPLLGSPKLDGFRCRIDPVTRLPMTNNWKPFVNLYVRQELAKVPFPLDGEIIVGKATEPGVLQRTSSGVTSLEGWPDFTFFVFDVIPINGIDEGFSSRYTDAMGMVKHIKHKRVGILPQRLLKTIDEVIMYEDECLRLGYEGIMLRDPNGIYKFGRSTAREGSLWRIKPFEDSEMRVEGWYEQEANHNEAKLDELGRTKRSSHKAGKSGKGVLGGFTGTDIHDGTPVRVGTGFTDVQRAEYWSRGYSAFNGQLLKYKRQKAGMKDKARHPVFLAWRPESDVA